MCLFKNAVLIYWLANVLPETRTWNQRVDKEIIYAIYEFWVPILISLLFCVVSTLLIKQRGFKDKAIPLYVGTPIIAKLLANALSCSGSSALIVCGLF